MTKIKSKLTGGQAGSGLAGWMVKRLSGQAVGRLEERGSESLTVGRSDGWTFGRKVTLELEPSDNWTVGRLEGRWHWRRACVCVCVCVCVCGVCVCESVYVRVYV